MSNEITYVQQERRPGMYTAYDAKGNVCGFVSRESMEADIAWREGAIDPDGDLDDGLYQRALDLAAEET